MSKLWSVSTQAVPDRFAGNAMVLLYDCDVSNVENDDCGDVHRRRMDRNPRNEIITVGIENLLEFPSGFSLKEYYCKRESVRGDGGRCMNEYLDKSRLCDDIVAFSDDEAKVVLARLENELKKIETALSLD